MTLAAPPPRSPARLIAARLLAAGILAAAAPSAEAPAAADLVWTDDDWSGGRYTWASAADAEIHPGLLIPANDPADMRFVAEPTDYRGIYAMAVYHDTLFLGAGPYPITAEGADIIAYDARTGAFATVFQPDEQGVTTLKVAGDTLYLPGPETANGYLEGSAIYLYNGHTWTAKQNVELSLHLFDLEVVGGDIYVASGDRDYIGSVRVSHDLGETWSHLLALGPGVTEGRRFYAVGGFQGRLYAQPDGREPETERIFAYDGAEWETIPLPGMPASKMGKFTSWGDSLFLNIGNRMYILHDGQVHGSWMPFSGDRWCQGFHIYKGALYGGADNGRLYRWSPGAAWTQITQLGLNPASEEISVLATCYGRLFIATARYEGYAGGRLYVSAAAPQARLRSLVHDFGGPTGGGVLDWVDFRPDAGGTTRFQVRSGATPEDLASTVFTGPDGSTHSFYETPGAALPAAHHAHRYFQYQVDLLCPTGLDMPWVDRVSLAVDTLAVAAATSPDETDRPAPRGRAAAPLRLSAPEPNPARSVVTLRAVPAATAEGSGTAVRWRVIDAQGRLVREARTLSPAARAHAWRWDLTDAHGAPVPAGVYLVDASLAVGPYAGDGAQRAVLVAR